MFESALKGDSFLYVVTALCCSFVRISHLSLWDCVGDMTSAIFVSSGRSSKCWVLNFSSLPCWQFLHPLNRLLISRVKTEKGGWGRERTSDNIIIVQKVGTQYVFLVSQLLFWEGVKPKWGWGCVSWVTCCILGRGLPVSALVSNHLFSKQQPEPSFKASIGPPLCILPPDCSGCCSGFLPHTE